MSKTVINTVGTSLLGNAKRRFAGAEASDAQMLEIALKRLQKGFSQR